MTPEERESVINEAVERALKLLPQTMSNLIQEHQDTMKLNQQFYKDHPEFKKHTDIVQNVIEHVDGQNPFLDYKELIRKAVPEIRQRIKTVGAMDVTNMPDRPNRFIELEHQEISDNGEL